MPPTSIAAAAPASPTPAPAVPAMLRQPQQPNRHLPCCGTPAIIPQERSNSVSTCSIQAEVSPTKGTATGSSTTPSSSSLPPAPASSLRPVASCPAATEVCGLGRAVPDSSRLAVAALHVCPPAALRCWALATPCAYCPAAYSPTWLSAGTLRDNECMPTALNRSQEAAAAVLLLSLVPCCCSSGHTTQMGLPLLPPLRHPQSKQSAALGQVFNSAFCYILLLIHVPDVASHTRTPQ